jgi:heterodisulfide reductase subunit B
MVKYLFFKGCTIPNKFPNIEKLAKDILPEIGIELEESEDFSCCPDPVQVQGANLTFWAAAAARNLAIAEEKGMNILTLCNGCINTLATVDHKLKEDAELRNKVNEILKPTGKEYKGTIKVKHLMQILKDEIGIDNLKKFVKKPLTGLKVAGHPGCHLLMPDEVLKFDDPLDPVIYDQFIKVLGAEPIDYLTKIECCGVSLALGGDKSATNKLIHKKILDVTSHGAEILSTPCPFCFQQFDMGQIMAQREFPDIKDKPVPVIYALELLALAMGKDIKDIGYDTHKIKKELKV